ADARCYQPAGERVMWRWRDWVINAYNRNLPFDQFTVEQLAGDLLPDATLDQKIASGFNRNHRGNGEGGIIPEEYAVEYVVDRVDTTYTVWLGLTMQCGRCHDHKFDPLTQKDFYQTFAYFNNVPEFGRAVKYGNSPPYIKTPTVAQQREMLQIRERLAEQEQVFARMLPEIAAAQADWEKTLDPTSVADWTITRGRKAYISLDGGPAGKDVQAVELQWENGEAALKAGKSGQAGEFDGTRFASAGDIGSFGFNDKFSLAAWIY